MVGVEGDADVAVGEAFVQRVVGHLHQLLFPAVLLLVRELPVFRVAVQYFAQNVADALALVGVVGAENVADTLFVVRDPLLDQQFEAVVEALLRPGVELDGDRSPLRLSAVVAHLWE